ncbi:MAG: cation:proton antiporter [SAR202 cluster bacterium]|nr:cation:proton antiporter [SAR202 cluster bacterium]
MDTVNLFTNTVNNLAASGGGSSNITHIVTVLLIQIGIILIAAKLAGYVASRFLKIPSVLAEIGIGILIGPFALGAFPIPFFGPLFPLPGILEPGALPVSNELFSVAQIGSIILLFAVGLETNFSTFLKYSGPATIVALGGVIFPFFLGAYSSVLLGIAGPGGIWSLEALFMGSILTATSVGITARVLADIGKLNSSEGTTIIAAAVIDDILGILILSIIVGISISGKVDMWSVGTIGAKAIIFWLALTGIGLLTSKYIERFLNKIGSVEANIPIVLGLALLCSGLAEMFGLAFIIGAFSAGLAFSTTQIKEKLEHSIEPIKNFLVPVFFVVMGMLVDVSSIHTALVAGLLISVVAILTKVLGSGLPALAFKFNILQSTRIGIGMMPRGEVALIIAGIGLSQGIINQSVFTISIIMTIITTILAPLLLVPLFARDKD